MMEAETQRNTQGIEEMKESVEKMKVSGLISELEPGLRVLADLLFHGGDTVQNAFYECLGFDILTKNPAMCAVLDKRPDAMSEAELNLLDGVFRLCIAASHDDGVQSESPEGKACMNCRIRSLQIRGVAEFALLIISWPEGKYPRLCASAQKLLLLLTEHPNICKLLCNRMDFTANNGEYKNEFSQNQHSTLCSLHHLCQPWPPAAMQILANLAVCPRLQRRLCDRAALQPDPLLAMGRLADAAAKYLNDSSITPELAEALVRLSGNPAFRASVRGCPRLLSALARVALTDTDGERHFGAKATRILAVSLVERGNDLSSEFDGKLAPLGHAVSCALWLRGESREKLLGALSCADTHPCEVLFTEIYRAAATAADLRSDGSLDFGKLLKALRQPEWADAPLLLFSGALMTLARTADAAAFMGGSGFDLLTKHRALPAAMAALAGSAGLSQEQEVLLAAAYRLCCALDSEDGSEAGRAASVRFLQMPGVLDHALNLLLPDQSVPMRDAALAALRTVSRRPDVCKLLCNKLNMLPHLHLLPAHGDPGLDVLDQFVQCPRFKSRLQADTKMEAAALVTCQALPRLNQLEKMRDMLGPEHPLRESFCVLIQRFPRQAAA